MFCLGQTNCKRPYRVCGVDGQTYLNPCEAEKENIEILHNDHCHCQANSTRLCSDLAGSGCITVYRPVCGVDGQTYGNICQSSLIQVPDSPDICCRAKIQCEGECPCCPDVHSSQDPFRSSSAKLCPLSPSDTSWLRVIMRLLLLIVKTRLLKIHWTSLVYLFSVMEFNLFQV